MTDEEWKTAVGLDSQIKALDAIEKWAKKQALLIVEKRDEFLKAHCTHTYPHGRDAVWSGIYDPPTCSICSQRV